MDPVDKNLENIVTIAILLYALGFVGYAINVVKLGFTAIAGSWLEMMVRAFGVVIPPLGAILGFVPMFRNDD